MDCDPMLRWLLSWVHIRDEFMALHKWSPFSNQSQEPRKYFSMLLLGIFHPPLVWKKKWQIPATSMNFDKFESIRSSPAKTKNRLPVSIIPALNHTLRGSSVQRKLKPRQGTIKPFIWNNVISSIASGPDLLFLSVLSLFIHSLVHVYYSLVDSLQLECGYLFTSFWWIGVQGFIII